MYLSAFTIFTSFLWFNFFIILTILLRKKNILYKKFSVYTLILVLVLCTLKAVIPIEFPFTVNVKMSIIMPTLQRATNYILFSFNFFNTNFNISVLSALIIFSLIISVVISFKTFYYSLKFYRFVNSLPKTNDLNITKILFDLQNISGVHKKMKVVIHNKIQSPAIMGYFNPVIILPEINFSDTEIKGILTHELMHYKYKHLIIKFFIEILKILFWWNPLIYFFSREVNNILEFHADKKLSTMLDRQEQKYYLIGTNKVIANIDYQRKLNPSYISIGLAENADNIVLVQRFNMIAENAYRKSDKAKSALLSLVIILLFLLSYMFVIQPYCEPTEEDYNAGAPFSVDDVFIISDKNKYILYNSHTNELIGKIPKSCKLYDPNKNEIILKPGSVSDTYSFIHYYVDESIFYN